MHEQRYFFPFLGLGLWIKVLKAKKTESWKTTSISHSIPQAWVVYNTIYVGHLDIPNTENITGRKVRTVFAWIVSYSSSIFWSNSISYFKKTFMILNKIYFKHYWILVSYNHWWAWPEGPYHAGVCLTHCKQKHTYKHEKWLLQEMYVKTYLSNEIGILSETRYTWCTEFLLCLAHLVWLTTSPTPRLCNFLSHFHTAMLLNTPDAFMNV